MTPTPPKHQGIASIHLDAVGGAAGDMFVACMLDAFPFLVAPVIAEITAVLPEGAGRPRLEEGFSTGIRVLRFGLETADASLATDHIHDHHHHHGEPDTSTPAPRGLFPHLVALIEDASIGSGTKRHAVAILTRLAEAEAQIHGVPIDEVHFHELADWDSLMDVVAAGSIIAALGPLQWSVSPLPIGSGVVKTAHGLLPVPAPATALLLKGFTMRDDGVPGERVTPTGAAIIAHLVDPAGQKATGLSRRLVGTGIGAGTRSLKGLPNILRALIFEEVETATGDWVEVIEFEVDDMTGEEIGVALVRLRETEGVLDVSTALRMGKKGRPMTEFRLLCVHGTADRAAEACFQQTSTIGLRLRREARRVLPREHSRSGDTRIKSVARPGGLVTRKAESDDLERLENLTERRKAAAQLEQDR